MKTGLAILLTCGFGITAFAAVVLDIDAPDPMITVLPSGEAIVDLPRHASVQADTEQSESGRDGIYRITKVTQPSLTIYPATNYDIGITVLVCPGGGYNILAYQHEGVEIAKWFNGLGITAAVLKYTVPGNKRDEALLDAQHALAILRQHPDSTRKLGMIGFSAGAHLTARTACSDTAPDFAILVYPAYIESKNGTFDPTIKPSDKTPPSFVVQSQDDYNYIDAAFGWHREMRKHRVPCELHIFPTGGHGYGLGQRFNAKGPAQWPALCEKWLEQFKQK